MKYYTIADPHAYYPAVRRALEEAGFFSDRGEKKLILCGDALDRGPAPRELVEFLISLSERDELIYILGNHEDLFYTAMQDVIRGRAFEMASGMSYHYRNGTWDTLVSLSGMSENEALAYPGHMIAAIRETPFYQTLLPLGVNYHETEHYIFCHGLIPVEQTENPRHPFTYDPTWREADSERWERARWLNGMDLVCRHGIREEGKTFVVGHIHAAWGHAEFEGREPAYGIHADNTPFSADGILALDASTFSSGFVNCAVIED